MVFLKCPAAGAQTVPHFSCPGGVSQIVNLREFHILTQFLKMLDGIFKMSGGHFKKSGGRGGAVGGVISAVRACVRACVPKLPP